jgi:hypothetical protein
MAAIITAQPAFVADLNDAFGLPGTSQRGSYAPVFMDK